MRTFTKGYGPACPFCGHIKSHRIRSGWSEPDDHYLRQKKCDGCAGQFMTVEVLIPAERTSFFRLDYHGRELRREQWRRKHAKTSHRQMVQKSDQLRVTVRVQPSKDFDGNHCFRGHEFTAENTYLNPSSGFRRCRTCRDIANRSNYLRNKDTWNRKRRLRAAERKAA